VKRDKGAIGRRRLSSLSSLSLSLSFSRALSISLSISRPLSLSPSLALSLLSSLSLSLSLVVAAQHVTGLGEAVDGKLGAIVIVHC
jgi:hypothetical protein